MSKSTPDAIERDLKWSLNAFKERAAAVKEAHRAARQDLLNDPMTSDLAKKEHLETLDKQTRGKLDGIKEEQLSYVRSLRDKLDRELRGNQPSDANSVLLRRDAADRARRITNEAEAVAVLGDAVRSGDDSLAHAVGYRARQSGWTVIPATTSRTASPTRLREESSRGARLTAFCASPATWSPRTLFRGLRRIRGQGRPHGRPGRGPRA